MSLRNLFLIAILLFSTSSFFAQKSNYDLLQGRWLGFSNIEVTISDEDVFEHGLDIFFTLEFSSDEWEINTMDGDFTEYFPGFCKPNLQGHYFPDLGFIEVLPELEREFREDHGISEQGFSINGDELSLYINGLDKPQSSKITVIKKQLRNLKIIKLTERYLVIEVDVSDSSCSIQSATICLVRIKG